jgi:hypothetical chaperone protein
LAERLVGIDFGTTNSALAVLDPDGAPLLAGPLRSILHFHPERREPSGRLVPAVGPAAVEVWLETRGEGRLIQSAKSFLASRLFTSTNVFGTTFSLQTLVSYILRELRALGEARFGTLGARAVVGRPVTFAGADEALALRRLRAALLEAGFRDVRFELEPIAAAFEYERRLGRDALVLVGDFGGGTSDFCLLLVGAERRVLGHAGVPIAGDAFDGKIVRHLVSPRLGRGDRFESVFGRVLPVPSWLYAHLERWHHVSFLRSTKTLRLLHDLRRDALAPEGLEALLFLVEHDLGFELYQAVQRVKLELSTQPAARFSFRAPPLAIEAPVARDEFEGWIADELRSFERCLDRLLSQSGVDAPRVDRVFLTGGSSLVPAVRRIFERRFGEERIDAGDEFVSVARGLALAARAG